MTKLNAIILPARGQVHSCSQEAWVTLFTDMPALLAGHETEET